MDPEELRVGWSMYVPPSQYVFRTETNLVEVGVVVRDRQGRVVGRLGKADFEVYDSGRQREVTTFSVQESAAASQTKARSRLVAILIDDVSLWYDGRVLRTELPRMQSAAREFVKEQLAPGDRVSIFSVFEGQVAGFTSDRNRMVAAIDKLTVHRGMNVYSPPLGMIQDIVEYLGKLPGNKMLLVASCGFVLSSQQQLDAIVSGAIRGGVVINALDAKGVYQVVSAHQFAALSTMNTAMDYLAEGTGGAFVYNTNDLAAGFRKVGALPEVSYLLGFPLGDGGDGRYHKLKIRVAGENKFRIQARPGYYAPDKTKTQEPPRERRIDREVLATGALNEAPATITVLSDKSEAGEPLIWPVAHVDVKQLRFATRRGRRTQKLTFIAALMDEHGTVVAGKEGAIEFALKDASWKWLAEGGMNAMFSLQAPPGTYRLRWVMQEEIEGKIAAATRVVTIR